MPRNLLRGLLVLATLAMIASGCGYRVVGRGGALPPSAKTIAVPALVNHTSTYRIEQRLTDAVVHELLARTSLRVVPNPRDADVVLRGDITSIEGTAAVVDPTTGSATTILVTVVVKVRLEDRSTGKILYRNDNLLFREPYEISTSVPSFFQEEGAALDRMSQAFGARVVADLLEGF